MPGVYECLEAERIKYAIRLPVQWRQVLQEQDRQSAQAPGRSAAERGPAVLRQFHLVGVCRCQRAVYVPFFTWSGFYLGINGGYGFGTSRWTDTATTVSTGDFNTSGRAGGKLDQARAG